MPEEKLNFYKKHVFICENYRDDGRRCCHGGGKSLDNNAISLLRRYLKQQSAHGKGKIRINRAGCFDLCQMGPVMVVYPDNIWYRYDSFDDLKRIADQHLINDCIVSDLVLSFQPTH